MSWDGDEFKFNKLPEFAFLFKRFINFFAAYLKSNLSNKLGNGLLYE
jgi:hypothetical protein